MVDSECEKLVLAAASRGSVHLRVAELAHVEHISERCHFFDLSEGRVESLYMKHEHFWKAH